MNKNSIVIIAIQFTVIVMLSVFAVKQRSTAQAAEREAIAQRAIAEKSVALANELRTEADRQRKIAELNAREVRVQAEAARLLASKCK